MNADVEITVLKRTQNMEWLVQYADSIWEPCERLHEGQRFMAQGAEMPEGFCCWAWVDIQKYVLTLARGGNFLGTKPSVFVTCCTDGFRSVLFKLERINFQ